MLSLTGSSSPSSLSLVDDDSLQPEDGPLDDAQQRRQLDHFFEENPQYADLASKLVKTTYHPSRVLVQAAEEQVRFCKKKMQYLQLISTGDITALH